MRLLEALELAFGIKAQECSRETMLDYRSYINNFKFYWVLYGDIYFRLEDFKKRQALHYLDFLLLEKKHEAITQNNNLRGMKVIFNVLTEREYISDNPFVGIKLLS
ncbi:phage integrase N-terminal SAM-like domain-containing protein [Aureispira sp. CCB-E]|uniref:phage integrase N-terminal SAM-like domain-containing protein n=1 Tax=Aureispira sp. CCB-E TaxID=3051121 RepID=UPI0028685222|nr:phage integrase N-terminal SAM-like domain-containing protein [Aureispira sp. CCB-E]WMX16500.1 phage integrase N-terminal SAM-like domain-containing protein [Aureispira sp. CCB-E]